MTANIGLFDGASISSLFFALSQIALPLFDVYRMSSHSLRVFPPVGFLIPPHFPIPLTQIFP